MVSDMSNKTIRLGTKTKSVGTRRHNMLFSCLLTLMILFSTLVLGAYQSQQPVITLEQFVQYTKLLQDEARNYRSFIQNFSILSGTAVVIFAGLLGWMNWKSRDDVRKEVQRQLGDMVRAEVERQSPQINLEITRSVNEVKTSINTLKDDFMSYSAQLRQDVERRKAQVDRMFFEVSGTLTTISARDRIPPDVDKRMSGSEVSITQERINGLRILWVDDVPSNNEYPSSVLSTLGAKINTALNTENAIVMLGRQDYHLVISDMGRNGHRKAGLDMLRIFKEKNLRTPVIFYCSPRGEQEFKSKALEMGAFAITSNSTSLFGAIGQFVATLQ